MNFSSVEFIVGRLLLVCSIAMLLPITLAVTLLESDVLAMLLSAALTFIIGYSFTIHGNEETSLTNREAIMTVCVSWVMLSICGSFPYIFSGTLPLFYAIIESASGFTTVGATLIPDLNITPKSVLLWRSMTQWLGGMGIIVLFISFLPHYGSGAINMFNAELPGPSKDRVMPRIRDTASLLWKIYTGMTIFFILTFSIFGLSFFDAVSHSMSTISTGGFSSYNEGVKHFNSFPIEALTALFTISSAVSFYLYYNIYNRGWQNLFKDVEFKAFISIILFFTILITYDLISHVNYPLGYALHYAFFHVASAMSSSGMALGNLSNWPPLSKFIIFLLMFVGGCAASTAGGLKVARVIILFKISWIELKNILYPQNINNVKMNNKTLDIRNIVSISRYFFVFVAVYLFSTFILVVGGLDFTDAMIIMASIIGTAGTDLSFALLENNLTFLAINDFSKVIMTLCMILGRLEFFTILVLLRPEFWRKTRNW